MRVVIVLFCVLLGTVAAADDRDISDDEIRRILIQQSIASYSGNCPCPYSRANNGSRCGKRSAYSRPGGVSPLCYPSDVTAALVKRYLEANESERYMMPNMEEHP